MFYDQLLSDRIGQLLDAIQTGDSAEIEKSKYLVVRALDRCRIVYGTEAAESLSLSAKRVIRDSANSALETRPERGVRDSNFPLPLTYFGPKSEE